ncbi:MAG: TIGR04211 family SH3 domain-containing protein [Gammaproteobacteria bacterium]|nr:TIGR04211 family SH3 domain-containing protein [Gammaproteobacteria bacterium]MCW8986967.1 TIGR04211 family SH3 domain-containing protein [Gammaproteobacteria bacterium]MCW9032221.1 TIGR04211 family SH3 domain-containing protein [Gammaproteobacteria bacterium]
MKTQQDKSKTFFYYLPRYLFSFIISLLVLSSAANVNAAEYVYISDNLRVGVRTEPVSGVPPISVVFTGMRLEVHERVDGYVKITTDKGVTGWIKDIYVTDQAPAIIQLNAIQEKYEKLKKELAEGGDTAATLEKSNLALSEQIEELKVERRDWAKERATLMASQYKESSWLWIVEVIALIVLSFIAGIYWYKNHVMKRLGGLRV